MGRHGSPGPVDDAERIYRILVAPTDTGMNAEQIAVTAISHSETIGMSVLRNRATDDEFRTIIKTRTAAPGRSYVGVIEFDCGEIRQLRSANSEEGRRPGDRHFLVVDTDMSGLPHHADVFNTLPRQGSDGRPTAKAVWRREREKLLEIAHRNIIKRDVFRAGRV